MKKKWHTEPMKWFDEKWRAASGGFVCFNEKDLVKILGKTANYATIFTYMFRRFGPSQHGSDDYKEIMRWWLTTPDPNVGLTVSPRPGGLIFSFGYAIKRSVYNNNEDEKQVEAVMKALLSAVADLMEPTYIRDEYMSAAGDADYPEQNEDDEDEDGEIGYFKWAGYGISHKYYEEHFGSKD